MEACSLPVKRRAACCTSWLRTPVISATCSGVYTFKLLPSSSKLSVWRATNSSSSNLSLIITLARPFISATSVPNLGLSQRWANGVSSVCRGLTSNSLAPLYLTALFMAYPTAGAETVGLAPITIITSDRSSSSSELVVPGKPIAHPRPTRLAEP